MATQETWDSVKKYFRPDSKVDKWGDPNAISDAHLFRLYDFRVYLGMPIYVTAGVKTSGHAKKSYHYRETDNSGNVIRQPCATDIIIPDYENSPFDLIMDACRFFNGIGYYPHWKFSGITFGGLHVDSRPHGLDADGTLNYKRAQWMGIIGENGKQRYIPLTFENLIKYTNFALEVDSNNSLH
jgi:hypothetical protein